MIADKSGDDDDNSRIEQIGWIEKPHISCPIVFLINVNIWDTKGGKTLSYWVHTKGNVNKTTLHFNKPLDDILQDQKSLTSVEEYKKCWTMYMQPTTYIC